MPETVGPSARLIIEKMAAAAGPAGLIVGGRAKRHAPDAQTAIRYAAESQKVWVWIEGPGEREQLPAVVFWWSLAGQDQIFDYHVQSELMERIMIEVFGEESEESDPDEF